MKVDALVAAVSFVLMALLVVPGVAGALEPPSPQVLAELAPTGTLRTAHIVAAFAKRDTESGQLNGLTVDLAQAIARKAGLSLKPIGYDSVPAMFEALAQGESDLLFLANDPTRAGQVDYAGNYMEAVVTYLVPSNSSIRSISDVDHPGIRIAVPAKNAADLYLTRNIKSAQLLRGPNTVPYLTEMMRSKQADAAAGSLLELLQVSDNVPGMRIVDGRFTAIPHAIAIPKGRPLALAFIRDFIEEAKASGLVQEAITRSGIPGVAVAPAAK